MSSRQPQSKRLLIRCGIVGKGTEALSSAGDAINKLCVKRHVARCAPVLTRVAVILCKTVLPTVPIEGRSPEHR